MSEAQKTRTPSSELAIAPLGLLWLGLAVGYMAASAGGHRALALGVIGLMAGALLAATGRRVMGVLAGLTLAGASQYWADSMLIVVYLPPLAAFAFMAFFFHRTLRSGAVPLITRVARKEHPDLPPEMARYTRRLTWAWSLCFVMLFFVALVLAPLLTLDLWSRWVHGLGYAVPSLLFLGEYAYRHQRFPYHLHGSLVLLVLNIVAASKEAVIAMNTHRTQDREGHDTNMLPLLRHRAPGDAVLLSAAGEVTVAAFLAQVHGLAQALPGGKFVVNLCETRHGFMLGFAAALLRGQTSLLPPGQGRGDWEQLLQQYPDAYLLSDALNSSAALGAQHYFDLSPFFATGAASEMQIPQIDSAHKAAILFTSGSTGQPGAHSKTWGQLCSGAASLAAALQWPDYPSCAVVGSVPAQHMFGLEATVMLPWCTGVAVHAQKPLLPADLEIVLLQSARPNWWMTTPMHLRAALHARGAAALPGLEGVVASTMSLPAALASAAEAAWQVPIMEVYGSTETGALALRRTAAEKAWTPLASVTLWPEGEAGKQCIWASGAHVGPAVQLGDELELHPDGRFLWLGRSSDLIKVGGKRASLAALNQHLIDVPGVDDGVYFFPQETHSNAPQRPLAFYVSATLAAHEVLKILRKRMDPLFVPRPLYRVAQLPRNANGKLSYAALVNLLAECKAPSKTQYGRVEQAHAADDSALIDNFNIRDNAPLSRARERGGGEGVMNLGNLNRVIAASHPALPGHFPGDQLVPGVIILEHVMQAIGARFPHIALGTLLSARFHAPLKPGEDFCVAAQLRDEQVRFEVRFAARSSETPAEPGALIASGQWAYRVLSGVVAADV